MEKLKEEERINRQQKLEKFWNDLIKYFGTPKQEWDKDHDYYLQELEDEDFQSVLDRLNKEFE